MNYHTPTIAWQRPDLLFPNPFDTIFFDIDGVLIKTTDSFRTTDLAVTEYVTGTLRGLDWGQRAGKSPIELEDIKAFKQAGGFNDDRDMCYLLASLATARLREWHGTPLAQRTIEQWAELAHAAYEQGHGGREWVDTTFPDSARVDYQVTRDLYYEYYWGTEAFRKYFRHEV